MEIKNQGGLFQKIFFQNFSFVFYLINIGFINRIQDKLKLKYA